MAACYPLVGNLSANWEAQWSKSPKLPVGSCVSVPNSSQQNPKIKHLTTWKLFSAISRNLSLYSHLSNAIINVSAGNETGLHNFGSKDAGKSVILS